jgi:hypothetical protein
MQGFHCLDEHLLAQLRKGENLNIAVSHHQLQQVISPYYQCPASLSALSNYRLQQVTVSPLPSVAHHLFAGHRRLHGVIILIVSVAVPVTISSAGYVLSVTISSSRRSPVLSVIISFSHLLSVLLP